MSFRSLKTTVIPEAASLWRIAREQAELKLGLLGLVEGKEYGMYASRQRDPSKGNSNHSMENQRSTTASQTS